MRFNHTRWRFAEKFNFSAQFCAGGSEEAPRICPFSIGKCSGGMSSKPKLQIEFMQVFALLLFRNVEKIKIFFTKIQDILHGSQYGLSLSNRQGDGKARRKYIQSMESTAVKIMVFLLCALLYAAQAGAYEKIFSKHCATHNVPKELAVAVAKQESGLNPFCINVAGKDYWPENHADAKAIIRKAQSKDLSYDVGIMQINSQWVKKWKIDPVSLLDPDTNIRLGVRLLRDEIDRHGLNWKAVGKYHSPNPMRGMQYAGMVSRRIKGNPELKSKLSNPRLAMAMPLRKNVFKKYEPLNLIHAGHIGQDHDQRSPIGWSNIMAKREQWLGEAKSRVNRAQFAKRHRRCR